MQKKNIADTDETAVQSETAPRMVQPESVYTAEELSQNAERLFGVRAECVAAALKAAAISVCTVSIAKEIVKEFMRKEIV